MGWEETVLKATKLNQMGFADGRIHTYAIDINTLLKAQAKAAYEVGFVEGQADKGHNDAILAAVRAAREEGKKDGRQEVVDLVEVSDWNFPMSPLWDVQKKLWGLARK